MSDLWALIAEVRLPGHRPITRSLTLNTDDTPATVTMAAVILTERVTRDALRHSRVLPPLSWRGVMLTPREDA
jgi:hypothetical protein